MIETRYKVGKWTAYPHYGQSAYRIWLRKTPLGEVHQLHEWKTAEGNIEPDDCWIQSGPFELWHGDEVPDCPYEYIPLQV